MTTTTPLSIGKSYLVSEADMKTLPPPPRGKRALIVNTAADIANVVSLIAVGIQTIFNQGCVLDYTYQDTEGGIHGHIFTEVTDDALIPVVQSQVLAAVHYPLQKKDGQINPHPIGKSSTSTIWTKPKS